MLQHLFKLTWNKKKQHFLILLEVFVSFIVLFAVFSTLLYRYKNYKDPVGFAYKDVWAINIFPEGRSRNWGHDDSATGYHEPLRQVLQSFPEVVSGSFSNFNTPFASGQGNTMVSYKGNNVVGNFYMTDEGYDKVLGLSLLEGRWYNKLDQGKSERAVVINKTMKEKLFQNQPAVGQIIKGDQFSKASYKVVGVVADFKDKGDFRAPESGFFQLMNEEERNGSNTVLAKMKQGSGASVEDRLQKALSNAAKGATVRIERLDDQRKNKNQEILIPTIILLIVCAFLIINVGLGLFGVLWYNINKRRSEIGLRRAVGATGRGVSLQLVGEALAMATLAMVAGVLLAVQFPLLNVFDMPASIYSGAIAVAIVFIYILVLICALYPGRQAAQIVPAVVLHED